MWNMLDSSFKNKQLKIKTKCFCCLIFDFQFQGFRLSTLTFGSNNLTSACVLSIKNLVGNRYYSPRSRLIVSIGKGHWNTSHLFLRKAKRNLSGSKTFVPSQISIKVGWPRRKWKQTIEISFLIFWYIGISIPSYSCIFSLVV